MRIRRPHFSEKAARVTVVTVVVVSVAVLVLCIWAVMWLSHENAQFEERDRESIADRKALRGRLDQDEAAIEALTEQLRLLGEKPVVSPEDVPDGADVVVIPGPQGPRGYSCVEELGYPRCRGDEGASGIDGAPGRDGTDGLDGANGATGPMGPPGPAGPQGEPGAPGKDGRDGVDGRDGTAQPGTYSCPEGEHMTGFGVAEGGAVTVYCAPAVGPQEQP